MDSSSCHALNRSNSKNLVNGWMLSIKPTMAIVRKTITATKLFLYFKVIYADTKLPIQIR